MTDWRDRHSVVPAVYVIFRDGGKILLLKRANTGYMDGFYSLPSGHLDGDEPAIMAAVREVKEEVGVDVEPKELRLVHTLHRKAETGDHERIDLGFEVRKWRGTLVNAEPSKSSGIKWVASDDLPQNTIPLIRQILDMIAKHQPYSDANF